MHKKQPYIYFVRLTFKNRHFFRYLICLLGRGHIILTGGFDLFDNQESIFNGEWIVFIDAVVEHDTVSMVDFMLNNN